jgi:cytidylate kinase
MTQHDLKSKRTGPVIAIDGPAGTGKSTATKRMAEALGYTHIDTGALYRCIAYLGIEKWASLAEVTEERAVEIAKTTQLVFRRDPDKNPANRIYANGRDLTEKIRTPEVSMGASRVSAFIGVRAALLDLQRQMGVSGRAILEGRDIGTVVFPDAELKFFLTASLEERAKRRLAELEANGVDVPSFQELMRQIAERDHADSNRDVAPLKQASDAEWIDTSSLTLDDVVKRMIEIVRAKGF